VISQEPVVLCISGFTMAKKLNEGNAKVQLEALIVHELSHIGGTTESEAVELQQQYLKDMQFVSKESIQDYATDLQSTLWDFQNALPNLISKYDNTNVLQMTMSKQVDRAMAIAARSRIPGLSLYDSRNRDQADNLMIDLVYILQTYVWRDFGTNPEDSLANYTKGFKGAKSIEVKEWLMNSGMNQVYFTSTGLHATKIESKDDYVNEITKLFRIVYDLQTQVVNTIKAKFEIDLDGQ
jgi:hypothetical protein